MDLDKSASMLGKDLTSCPCETTLQLWLTPSASYCQTTWEYWPTFYPRCTGILMVCSFNPYVSSILQVRIQKSHVFIPLLSKYYLVLFCYSICFTAITLYLLVIRTHMLVTNRRTD